MRTRSAIAMLSSAAIAAAASAGGTLVQVDIYGSVDFNVIQGNQAGNVPGTPAHMSFLLNSDNFVNSGSFPTRGYEIDLTSWTMDVGGDPINILNPQPFGPAYFVLRDNDPAVDGFLVSSNVDFPVPIGVTVPGLVPDHELGFSATYTSSTVLSSLNIVDAVGSYDLTGISSFHWWVGRFGTSGAEYIYESMTIAVVPAPASAGLLGVAGLVGLRRRRA